MSILVSSTPGLAEIPPEPVRRFTVEEYHQMIRTGILKEDDPFELLEGWLVPKMSRNPPHDVCVSLVEEEIRWRLPAGYFRRAQLAVTTVDSEPEPDVAVIRGTKRDYLGTHPQPQNTAMMVEVADSSLHRDRTIKLRVYARARIPVYWIVNIPERRVEVYTDPYGPEENPSYRQRREYGPDDSVPLVLDGVEVGQIPGRDILP
jgi:Uma2 family endonuclease